MNPRLDLNEQNKITVMLMQALWGAISPNFRMVALAFAEPIWQLLFVLEHESAADRDEIENVVEDFDVLLQDLNPSVIRFEAKILVTQEPLSVLDPALWQMVFRRWEEPRS